MKVNRYPPTIVWSPYLSTKDVSYYVKHKNKIKYKLIGLAYNKLIVKRPGHMGFILLREKECTLFLCRTPDKSIYLENLHPLDIVKM